MPLSDEMKSRIVDNNKNNNGKFELEGTTIEEKKANAKEVVENIAGSKLVMNLLEDASNDNESSIKQITSNIGGDTTLLKEVINDSNANLSDADRATLNRLFGNI